MTPQEKLIYEVANQYGEWLEHSGERGPQVMIHLLASLLIKEKKENEYLKKVTVMIR